MEIGHALEHWREFYLLVGTGGGTLVALLFVAVSLGTGYLTFDQQLVTRIFFSPVVIHFAVVFFLSCVALMPPHPSVFLAAVTGAAAAAGLCVSAYATVQIWRHKEWTQLLVDYICYGLLPALTYAALGVTAWMMFKEAPLSLDLLAGTLMLLLAVNIRNAWDLMLEMVRRHKDP